MSGILVVVLIFFALGAGLGAVAFFTYQKKLRRAKAIERGLKMVPILIHLPPQSSDTEAGTRDLREVMREKTAQAEVLYNLIAGTATDGFKSTFYGQRHIAFELIVSEGLVHFYAAVPVALVSVVKKAVLTAYPGARLNEAEDHNIFNQEGRLAATLGGEMVLRAESGYPIATYDQLERDPMEALLTTVSALEKTDGVAVQIMLRPAGEGWTKKAIALADGLRKGKHAQGGFSAMDLAKAAVTAPSVRREDEKAQNGGSPYVSKLQLSQVERIEEKTKHPGFEVLVRVLVSTGSTVRSQQLLRDISTVFSLFENPGLNGFKFLPALDVQGLVTAFIFRFFPNELSSNVLNSAELATLFHLPDSQFTPSTNVDRLQSKQVDGPVQLPSSGLLFGYNEFRGVKKEIRLSLEDRRRHTYILGQTGTGKSTMLENLAVQDMLAGNGFAFIDPHGDSAEKLLALVPKERAEDVIYFNPADAQYPLGLNLFEFKDPAQKDFLVQETINMLYKLYDPGRTGIIGPRYEHWYRNAALTLMADPGGSTFIEIPKVFTDTDYLKHKFKYLKDPTVIDFWTKEMGQTSDFHKSEMLGWFVSKFGAFQNNEMMRNIIGQTKSSFDIRDVMDNKKILIVNLSKGRIGELNSQLLGMIFVIKFQAAAMSRANIPENERTDFALYVDEFQNFSTDSFASILSEARKYRLNLIVANQFIGQLSNEIRDAVFGNIGTIVAHRMGPDDAEFMVKQFAPVFDASDLVNIPNYTAAMRLMIGGLPSQPFSIADSAPIGTPNVELGMAIKQLSAAKYGHDKAVVEADLIDRLSGRASVPVAPAAVTTPTVAEAPPAELPLAVAAEVAEVQVSPVGAGYNPTPAPVVVMPVPLPAPFQPALASEPIESATAAESIAALALTSAPAAAAFNNNVPPVQATATLAIQPPPIGAPPLDAPVASTLGSTQPIMKEPARFGDTPSQLPQSFPVSLPPIGAPPISIPLINDSSATISDRLAATAIGPVFNSPVDSPPAANASNELAQMMSGGTSQSPVQPPIPNIAAPTVTLPPAPPQLQRAVAGPTAPPPIGAPPVSLPGTLSLNDITGGRPPRRDTPEPSPLDDIPLLGTPMTQPYYTGDGEPLADDPYAGIDVMGASAPVAPQLGVADALAVAPQQSPAVGDGEPLDGDPYAHIDILGGTRLAQPAEQAQPMVSIAPDPVMQSASVAVFENSPTITELTQQFRAQPAPEPAIRESDYNEPEIQLQSAPAPAAVSVVLATPPLTPQPRTLVDSLPTSLQMPPSTTPAARTPAIEIRDNPNDSVQAKLPDTTAPDWSNAPEPMQAIQESPPAPDVDAPSSQTYAPEVPPEPLIHFLDPAAEKLLSEPEQPIRMDETHDIQDVKPSLTGLPDGVELIDIAQPQNNSLVTTQPAQLPSVAPTPASLIITPLNPVITSNENPFVPAQPDVPVANLEFLKSVVDTLPEPMAEAALHGEMPTLPDTDVRSSQTNNAASGVAEITDVPRAMNAASTVSAVIPTQPNESSGVVDSPGLHAKDPFVSAIVAVPITVPPLEARSESAVSPNIVQDDFKIEPPLLDAPVAGVDDAPVSREVVASVPAPPQLEAALASEATLTPAASVQKAEHEIDDLLSVSLIHSESTPGHHRLPDPILVPSGDDTSSIVNNLPGPTQPSTELAGEPHTATHHGLKIIQPLEPIVPAKERFAAELAAMNAAESSTQRTPPLLPNNTVKAQNTVDIVGTPTVIKIPESMISHASVTHMDVSPANLELTPAVISIISPPVAQISLTALPQPAVEEHDQPIVISPNTVISLATNPLPAPTETVVPETVLPDNNDGIPEAISLASADVAKARAEVRETETQTPSPEPVKHTVIPEIMEHEISRLPVEHLAATQIAQADVQRSATEPVSSENQSSAHETKQLPKRRRRRGGDDKSKPAEIVASKEEANHNTPSAAAVEAAPLTGKLILPSGDRPMPELAQHINVKPKKLAPGEVYVDDKGNVIIGE